MPTMNWLTQITGSISKRKASQVLAPLPPGKSGADVGAGGMGKTTPLGPRSYNVNIPGQAVIPSLSTTQPFYPATTRTPYSNQVLGVTFGPPAQQPFNIPLAQQSVPYSGAPALNNRGQPLNKYGQVENFGGPGTKSSKDVSVDYTLGVGRDTIFAPGKTPVKYGSDAVKWGNDVPAPEYLPPPTGDGTQPIYDPGYPQSPNYLGNGGSQAYAWMSRLLNWNVNK
jgi:hypothetical protein